MTTGIVFNISHLNGIEQIDLLPYHNIAKEKYKRLSEDYKLMDLKEPSSEKMAEISGKLKSYGLKIKIGG